MRSILCDNLAKIYINSGYTLSEKAHNQTLLFVLRNGYCQNPQSNQFTCSYKKEDILIKDALSIVSFNLLKLTVYMRIKPLFSFLPEELLPVFVFVCLEGGWGAPYFLVFVFSFVFFSFAVVKNSCQSEFLTCEHECYQPNKGRAECRCRDGYTLQSDGESCAGQ